ncbi:uncharacterized protein LOC125946811 [Dermacentor silvarum]|uniref:uncharacterized protein LOC125946811 n=1 Tax=Dermacentor silvarum TaxID=543639 RepID=UPI002101503E|nr:uncharacterized protein LOC125946811 [Dermacentor silvarum]
MFKLAAILLLSAAVICTQMPDIFEGCIPYRPHHEEPTKCTFAHPRDLRGNSSFVYFAHEALKQGRSQPSSGNLNTLLLITRGAYQNYRDLSKEFVLRVEFLTTPSNCVIPRDYSVKECLPIDYQANGLCQAKFKYFQGTTMLQTAWCNPLM